LQNNFPTDATICRADHLSIHRLPLVCDVPIIVKEATMAKKKKAKKAKKKS